MKNKNLIIGLLVVVIVLIIGYIFFWNDVTAPSETELQDSELPDRSNDGQVPPTTVEGEVELY